MPTVELQHISKRYEAKTAVHDLSLRIDAGTMFGLLGPNGSGKTSSIRMIIGMTMPDSGTVSLFNQPFDRKFLARVGYLPEERGLYKKMKVIDQLVFFGRLHGLSATTASKRAYSWCERLEISEAIFKHTEELSKGMQQKIQFIAALLHHPELLIMDEPFSGLDPVNASVMMNVLLDFRKNGGSILFSTHRMDQVEKFCDEIALIHNGRLVLEGGMREVKSRFRRHRVQIVFDGSADFLTHASVAEAKNLSGYTEIRLKPGSDAQALLDSASSMAKVSRFEIMEPTLEEIFIEVVGGGKAVD